MKKSVKIAILVIGILVILPLTALIILSEIHSGPAHRKTLEFFNEEIGENASFEEFSISYIRHFPRIHIKLENIVVRDGQTEVLRVGTFDVMLHFNSLWNKKLNVEKVVVSEASLFSEIDSLGRKPVLFAGKKKTPETRSSGIEIDSQKIRIVNSTVYFGNQVKGNRTYLMIDEATLHLALKDSVLDITGSLLGQLDSLISNNTVLFTDQPVEVDSIDFKINLRNGDKVLDKGYIVAHGLKLYPRFSMSPNGDGQDIEFHISGEGNFNAFLDLFEFHIGIDLQQINPDAELRMSYNQYGFVNPFLRPYSELDFEIIDGDFTGETLPYPIEKVHLKGNYNNGEGHSPETVKLEIDTLHAEVQGSFVDARLKLSNLKDPLINAHFISSIDISHLVKQTENFRLKGIIDTDLKIDGKISELKALHLEGKQMAIGSIRVKDLELLINDKALKLELISGISLLNNHILEVTSLVGAYNEAAFHFQGLFNNLDQFFLTEDEKLGGSFVLNFDRLDLREMKFGNSNSKPNDQHGTMLPLDGLTLELDVTGKEIITDFGSIENLRLKSRLEKKSLQVHSVNFKYQDGYVSGTGDVKLGEKGIASLNADIKGIFKNLDFQFPKGSGEKSQKKSGPIHLPENSNIHVDLKVDRGVIEKIPVKNMQLKAGMQGNEISLEKFVVDVFDGHAAVDGGIKVDSAGIKEIRMNGGMAFDQIDLAVLMDDFGDGGSRTSERKKTRYPEKISLNVELKVREIDYKDITLRNFSAGLKADNKQLSVSKFYADLPFGNLSMDLVVDNYQTDKIKYLGAVSLDIDSLQVDKFLELKALGMQGNSGTKKPPEIGAHQKKPVFLPGNIILDLAVKARYLNYKQTLVEDLEMALAYSEKKIEMEKLKFNFSGGNVEVNGYVNKDNPDSFPGYLYSKADNVDIRELLLSFDNFDQDKFTADNSSGKISSASHMYFELDKSLVPMQNSNLWIMNFNVNEAEFDQVEPIEKTLFFVGHKSKDKMIINKLNINAFLFRDKLYFRDVLMNDNIANLDVFGEVDLDDRTMGLGLEISLTDLFFRSKSKRVVQTNDGEIDLEKDSKLFLNLTGPLTDHKLKVINKRKFNNSRDELTAKIKNAEKAFKGKQTR